MATRRLPTLSELGIALIILGAVFGLVGCLMPVERHELVSISGIVETVLLVPSGRYRCAQIKIVIQSSGGIRDVVVCDSEDRRRLLAPIRSGMTIHALAEQAANRSSIFHAREIRLGQNTLMPYDVDRARRASFLSEKVGYILTCSGILLIGVAWIRRPSLNGRADG
jgi:hypothetical protein